MSIQIVLTSNLIRQKHYGRNDVIDWVTLDDMPQVSTLSSQTDDDVVALSSICLEHAKKKNNE
jgi:hypothetical protein